MLRWGRGPVPLRRVTVLGLLGVVALAVGGCGFGPRYHDGDKVTYKAHVVSVSEVRNGWWDARIIFDTGDWKGRTGFFGDQDYGWPGELPNQADGVNTNGQHPAPPAVGTRVLVSYTIEVHGHGIAANTAWHDMRVVPDTGGS
jgi:hypothetical protein